MKYSHKGLLGRAAVLAAVLAFGCAAWNKWLGRTHIAFVNFQPISLQQMARANDNSSIRLAVVGTDELGQLDGYDMVFINGMGLRLTAEQRALVQEAVDGGTPVYTQMATSPDNDFNTFSDEDARLIAAYLTNSSNTNSRSLLSFVRSQVDGKIAWCGTVEEPVVKPSDYLYHAAEKAGDDDLVFTTVEAYETFMKAHGLYREGQKRVMVSGAMADPTELVAALEKEGLNVYPVSSFLGLKDYAEQIRPHAIINMAHGRLGDDMVAWLKANDVLLFDPLTLHELTETWENDPMGMSGGFMSQSVVMPEIDGAIRTSVLFAQYRDADGMVYSYAVPERLQTYVENVKRYLRLRETANADKRVAIVYYKGPGQGNMTAGGMEVMPSLYNVLLRLRAEGYNVEGLPASLDGFADDIRRRGSLFNSFAEGSAAEFMRNGHPQLVNKADYEAWVKASLRPGKYAEVEALFGAFPGVNNRLQTADGQLAFPCIRYGNIALLPQPAAGEGTNDFQVVHGTEQAPPHSYIAPYLWIQHGFKADALVHFGTHGSLEFTPKKQVALSNLDWPDRLVGALPHFYIYSIDNVGEAMIAKRRSYADIISHLTPPFRESNIRSTYKELCAKINAYAKAGDNRDELSLQVKALAEKLEIHLDLGLDTVKARPYTAEEIERVENYAEELSSAKITGELYTMGRPYSASYIRSSVLAMTVDPIAYSRLALDRLNGKTVPEAGRNTARFYEQYLVPAQQLVADLLDNAREMTDGQFCTMAGITPAQLAEARRLIARQNAPKGMLAMMQAMKERQKNDTTAASGRMKPASGHPGGMPASVRHKTAGEASPAPHGGRPDAATSVTAKAVAEPTKEQLAWANAVNDLETAVRRVALYRAYLSGSPEREMQALLSALGGGYIAPSPGGDPIASPNTLPTGRNLFAVNAEETPTPDAWEKGVELAKATLAEYGKRHNGDTPRKVSYTLWSGEFIQTGGATVAQILYMLGVEPVRDRYGRVTDVQLIPSETLGRPRIDVVVQTSGQLRDLAASRLFLVNKAVEMAAAATGDKFDNRVREGVQESERFLIEQGVSPKEAREISSYRVFGGVGGNYGTGIQGMVEAGNAWENDSQIADVYMNNMGAFYGSENSWEKHIGDAFRAALTHTDVVVQPRQSNTWGALSLDHVYEFMGGMNLAVREVTGKDPDAYFSDYRNKHNVRMQESKEAIGVEARTKLFNPTYVEEVTKGGASAADKVAEMVRNTYGWNVMKPDVIDKEMWDGIYDVYVKDKFGVGVQQHFADVNPAAMQELTATMMEVARKGYWKATPEQLAEIARVHTDLVAKFGPSGSAFTGNNTVLQDFIARQVDTRQAAAYREKMKEMREVDADASSDGMVMEKQNRRLDSGNEARKSTLNGFVVVCSVLVLFVLLLFVLRYKRRKEE